MDSIARVLREAHPAWQYMYFATRMQIAFGNMDAMQPRAETSTSTSTAAPLVVSDADADSSAQTAATMYLKGMLHLGRAYGFPPILYARVMNAHAPSGSSFYTVASILNVGFAPAGMPAGQYWREFVSGRVQAATSVLDEFDGMCLMTLHLTSIRSKVQDVMRLICGGNNTITGQRLLQPTDASYDDTVHRTVMRLVQYIVDLDKHFMAAYGPDSQYGINVPCVCFPGEKQTAPATEAAGKSPLLPLPATHARV